MSTKPPTVHIIAGPNGAGKTTFAEAFLPLTDCREFINADLIARGLEPFEPQKASLRAGRLVLERIHELSEARSSFAMESTLAGLTYLSLLKAMKAKGYLVQISYLWIPKPALAVQRIKHRAANGGHAVPDMDVTRRFGRSLANFFRSYLVLADQGDLIDNSEDRPRLIAEWQNGTWRRIIDPGKFGLIQGMIK